MSTDTVAPSFDDLIAQGRAELQGRRPDLVVAEGDVTLADLHAAGAMADANLHLAVKLFKLTFLDFAEGDDLAALVNDRYNIQPFPATAAQVTLTFTRTSGGAGGTIAAGQGVTTKPDAGGTQVSFTTDAPIVVGAGSNGPFTVAATADDTGPTGNVKAATIVQIVGALFDTSFTVTNVTASGGGNFAETDDGLRERARSFWMTLRRGTLAALEVGAKNIDPPTVRIATAIEDGGSGLVTLLVTDADGNSTAEMVSDVAVEIENWRSAGVYVQVVGGSQLIVDMALGLVVKKGFDVDAVSDILVAAAMARMTKLRVQEVLYLANGPVSSAVMAQYPDDIVEIRYLTVVVGGAPAVGDPIQPGLGQVIRPGTITVEKVVA